MNAVVPVDARKLSKFILLYLASPLGSPLPRGTMLPSTNCDKNGEVLLLLLLLVLFSVLGLATLTVENWKTGGALWTTRKGNLS